MGLVIEGGVRDVIVVLYRSHIHTPLHVQVESGLSAALLRGDHYDTVCSSGSVKGVGGGILEDCH